MTGTTTIAGRYRIEGRLGVGGMSTVHLAFDDRLERYVAIKLLAEHLADDPTFVSRFRREALAAARLVHPNIVQVFDFGFDEGHHQHFIVMEHVAGNSCAELLRDRGHLDVPQALRIVTQACRGLDYAHRNGVVHRDVKPGNLLVAEGDVVKLADFGIARAADQSSITQVGSVLGTAAYLAPEQARGEEAGPRADLYSLGVVAYQLLSGRLPYEAGSLSELALKQQRESPTPLDQLNDKVPHELAEAIAITLSIDQESRPPDAAAFAESMRAGAEGISPFQADSPTRHLGTRSTTRVLPPGEDPTAATRIAPTTGTRRLTPQTAETPVPRRAARAQPPAEYRRRQAVAEPAAKRRRSGRGARRLGIFLLLALVFTAAVVIAVVIATSTSPSVVQLKKIVGNDAQSVINALQNLINSNTK
jgi:eukaryotic-like serine/threonine-protein kinase